jgi:hypothetical protein
MGRQMNWKGFWKEVVVVYRNAIPDTCLDEPRKTTQTISESSRCLYRDSKRVPPGYVNMALPLC